MPSRRAVLAAGALTFTNGLAGCIGAPPEPEPTFDAPTTAWPTAGYDPGGTGHTPAGPSQPEAVWNRSRGSFEPRLYGELSTPVVRGESVYVATLATRFYDPEDAAGILASLDRRTGNAQWVSAVSGGLTGGPALVGEAPTIVVGSRDGGLHAFDADGTSKWTVDIGGEVGTPTAYGTRLYVASGTGRLHAVDADGTRLWTADRPGPLELLFGSDEPVETVMPVADDRGVYVAFTPFERSRDEAIVLAYDHDGSRRWRTSLPGKYGRIPGGLAVTDDTLYATVGGTVYAVDAANGDHRWQFVTGTDTAGPPTVDDERVYVAAKNLYALTQDDGTEQWRVVNEAPPDTVRDPTALPYLSRPPLAEGNVYLRAGAIDAVDGSWRWRDDVDDWLQSGDYYSDPYYERAMAKSVLTEDALYMSHTHRGVVKFR